MNPSAKPKKAGKPAFHSRSFKEGLNILLDEIQLAFQWERPSILLAVHNSKTSQSKAQQALELELKKLDKIISRIKADSKYTDVISVMCRIHNHHNIVFFITGLGHTDDIITQKIFRALNMHRELLVEQQIRVVFWLTKLEAESLPHFAPDFWAFRHRVVEFIR